MRHKLQNAVCYPSHQYVIAQFQCGLQAKIRQIVKPGDIVELNDGFVGHYCPDCFAERTLQGTTLSSELGPLETDMPTTPITESEQPWASYL